jgi:hypothetical protein
MSEEQLRRELEDAFRGRAHIYRVVYDELAAELGPARAEQILSRAIEKRGREIAPVLFRGLGPDPVAVGERFLAVSPDGGRMYPNRLERRDGALSIQVHRCPLKDAWTEAGLAPDRVATLCRIAGAFDKGLFEAAGVGFANETWLPGREGCCRIHLDARR